MHNLLAFTADSEPSNGTNIFEIFTLIVAKYLSISRDSKYIITLNDEDIMTMLNYRLVGDEVDQLMEEKMQRLIF